MNAAPVRRTATRPAQRSRGTDLPRWVAHQAMTAIADGAYANLDLPRRLRREGLTGRDAAFATELVYGATRMRGLYDPVIARCAGRELDLIDPAVLDTLRLGVHQLLGMRVAAHAAVDQSVGHARAVHGSGAARFVNAVLRRVSEKDGATWQHLVTRGLGGDAALAVRYSHPEWMVTAFRQALLGHRASSEQDLEGELDALLRANNEAALVSLVARPGLSTVAELVADGAQPSPLSPIGARLAAGGDPGRLKAVRQARAGVQDEGSQLVTLALLAAASPVAPLAASPVAHPAAAQPAGTEAAGEHIAEGPAWLDMCAGPGGKAALLAAAAKAAGAVVYANDISEHRADLVHAAVRAAGKAGAEVLIGVGDARDIGAEEPDRYQLVLLDAPCTGLGALRRRPEARWRRSAEDLAALTGLQAELLDSAMAAVRPGGVVGYVTCSPHLAETRQPVAAALARRPGFRPMDVQPLVTDPTGSPVAGLGQAPYAQLWPHRHGTDGMFLAVLRREV